MTMSVPPLSHLVYSMACIYLAMVGLVGFTANAFVAFLYCKSKKVSHEQHELILSKLGPKLIHISASHSIQQAADVPDLGGGHDHHVRDTDRLPCQLEHVCRA